MSKLEASDDFAIIQSVCSLSEHDCDRQGVSKHTLCYGRPSEIDLVESDFSDLEEYVAVPECEFSGEGDKKFDEVNNDGSLEKQIPTTSQADILDCNPATKCPITYNNSGTRINTFKCPSVQLKRRYTYTTYDDDDDDDTHTGLHVGHLAYHCSHQNCSYSCDTEQLLQRHMLCHASEYLQQQTIKSKVSNSTTSASSTLATCTAPSEGEGSSPSTTVAIATVGKERYELRRRDKHIQFSYFPVHTYDDAWSLTSTVKQPSTSSPAAYSTKARTKYKCTAVNCPEIFNKEDDLWNHLKRHDLDCGQSGHEHTCTKCNSGASSLEALIRHLKLHLVDRRKRGTRTKKKNGTTRKDSAQKKKRTNAVKAGIVTQAEWDEIRTGHPDYSYQPFCMLPNGEIERWNYRCSKCPTPPNAFRDFRKWAAHQQHSHEDGTYINRMLACQFCKHKSLGPNGLEEHMKSHAKVRAKLNASVNGGFSPDPLNGNSDSDQLA